MDGISEAVGAARIITLGGKDYKVGELRVGEWADFTEWAKKNITDTHKAGLQMAVEVYGKESVPLEVATAAMAAPTRDEIDAESGTLAGVVHLLWLSMSKYNPEATKEDVSCLFGLEDIESVMAVISPDNDSKNVVPPAETL